MLDFDMFIEETAYHIIAHGDMKTKDQYVQFGRRLLAAYPCLEFPGQKTSWVTLVYVSHKLLVVFVAAVMKQVIQALIVPQL